ncbi:hypothetical protein BDZ45DRAFT_801703 [Acephala macrosclerotiorum]|nr:hypothetical protein BDZ45DRAFT_801703 [Acephala macrosclerotiorum]
MTSSRKGGSLRGDRGDGSGTAMKERSKAKSTPKGKTKNHSDNRNRETKPPIQEFKCVLTCGRKVPPRRKSMRCVPHAYTPFHHISLDVMNGLTDDKNADVDFDQDHEHDYIGDESTILTPSYDTTSLSSTIPTHFDEAEDWASYSRPGDLYSSTTHDLKFVGHWAEMDERLEMLPTYMQAVSLNRKYMPRRDVREAMVGIEVAFPSLEQNQVNAYGTERR